MNKHIILAFLSVFYLKPDHTISAKTTSVNHELTGLYSDFLTENTGPDNYMSARNYGAETSFSGK